MSELTSAFTPARLICPRCRRASESGALVRFPLSTTLQGDPAPAVPGALDDVDAIGCSNPDCLAQYPVVEGIPIVMRDPGAVDLAAAAGLDVTTIPTSRLLASVRGQAPDSPLSTLVSRISRTAWAAFHDWLADDERVPEVSCGVHATELMAWLGGFGRSHRDGAAVTVVVGAGLGREAWELDGGAALLLDAHLPTLLASQRLRRAGEIDVLLRQDSMGWRALTLRARRKPAVAVASVCCDAEDPPFDGGWAGAALLPNVIDSVANPYMVLMQSRALVRPGGELTVSSPFTWRHEVTARNRWLESLASQASAGPEDVVTALMTSHHDDEFELAGTTELSWCLRASSREAIVYRNTALRFVRKGQ